jgi:hypothetical protein
MSGAGFSRIVIGLYHNAPGDSVRMAAEIARLLHLELYGLFIEEQDLLDIAAMPFVRVLRPLGGGWSRIDAAQVARDLDHASRNARRLFTDAAKDLETIAQFQTIRGSLAETIASILQTGDIVIVAVPAHPAEHAGQRFGALMEMALRSSAAVLIVPRHVARRSGAVVAVAVSADDPAISAAAAIARAAREDLVVVERDHLSATAPRDDAILPDGLRVTRLRPGRSPASASEFVAILSGIRDRLVVVNHRSFDESVALALAVARRIPVLVLERVDRG